MSGRLEAIALFSSKKKFVSCPRDLPTLTGSYGRIYSAALSPAIRP